MTPERTSPTQEDIEEDIDYEEEDDESPSIGSVFMFDVVLWFILSALSIFEFAGYGGKNDTGLHVRFVVFSLCYAVLFIHAFYVLGFTISAFKRGDSNDGVIFIIILFLILVSLLAFGGMGLLYVICMSMG